MAQIFLSYKSTERGAVAQIAGKLADEGFSVWWDNSLLGGQPYSSVIQAEIDAADIVMPIWSRESVSSQWVSAEAERGAGKLLPVLIEDVTPPLPFNKLHTLDLVGWHGDVNDPRWRRLIADLRAILSHDKGRPQSLPLRPARRRHSGALVIGVTAAVALVAAASAVLWRPAGEAPIGDASPAEETPVEPAQQATVPASVEDSLSPAPATPAPRDFAEAVTAVRDEGARVSIEICANGECGLTRVRVGQFITLRIQSPIGGNLILIDQNARGERVQIFPNGLSSASARLNLYAEQVIEVPASQHGFVFGVAEPVGTSQLVALVLPDSVPLPAIAAENARTRGIVVIPTERQDEFAAIVAPRSSQLAVGELAYEVVH